VLHDGFLKIFKHIGKYNGTGSFEGWLKRIVIHVALDYIKKSQKISFGSQSNLENVPEEEESTYLHSEQLLNTGFSAQELLVLLHRIPEQYAAVFNLYYIDNLSHKEIAQAIEIDENTSRTRLHRAKIVLRKELEHELEKRQRAQIL
jgi:RNA polymerase sigma-70 factor (ECF subfamily)